MKNLKLKAARAAMDMSQQQLADIVGVSRQTINSIEKGDYNPSINLYTWLQKGRPYIRYGKKMGIVVESDWHTEVNNIRLEQVPDPERRAQLQLTLFQLNPKFVATGHWPCLKL